MRDDVRMATEAATTGGALGAAAGIARMIIFGQVGGISAYISVMVGAVTFGVVVFLITSHIPYGDQPLPLGVQWAIVIGSGILAKDILAGLRQMGAQFALDPLAVFMRILNAIRGKDTG